MVGRVRDMGFQIGVGDRAWKGDIQLAKCEKQRYEEGHQMIE